MTDIFDIYNRTDANLSTYKKDFINIFQEVKKVLNINESLELSLSIVSENEQVLLNKQFRNKDYIADVLTFPLDQEEDFNLTKIGFIHSLGDIFICYEQAKRQAELYQHSLRRELSFLFVHGMLHILGYDHQSEKEEKEMFSLQETILNNLQIFRNQLK